MANSTQSVAEVSPDALLRECVAALRRLDAYRLPPALDRRLLYLSENKDTLSESEREELLALVEFSEERTVEKLQAKAMLRRIAESWPHLLSPPAVTLIPASLRPAVVRRARNRCEYCLLSQELQVATFPIDHVLPRIREGATLLENLALACPRCNSGKWIHIQAVDPASSESVDL